jgi:N-methylhydantoinase B
MSETATSSSLVSFDAPIMAEVLRYEMLAVAEEMLITMRRATRSVLAREGADYGAAILDTCGRIVAQPVPFGFQYFQLTVPGVIEKYQGRFEPGDVVVTNDPYGGASHLPDIVVIKPFFADGEVAGYTAIAEHHTDIGGRFPGGNGAASESVFEEGLRLPAIKLCVAGEMVESVRAIIEANVRAPDDVLGDLSAALAACSRCEDSLDRLFVKYGRRAIADYWSFETGRTEQYVRKIIASFPDGSYRATAHFEDGDVSADVVMTMIVEASDLTFDLTGSSPQLRYAFNVPYAMATTMPVHAMLGFLGSLEGASLNSGLMAPVKVIVPPGTIANPAFPAPVGCRSQLYFRLVQAARDCLAQVAPSIMPAAGEGFNGAIFASPAPGAKAPGRMVTEFFASGWGARSDKDGIDGVMNMMLAGFRTASSEIIDAETALTVEGFGLVPDSAGAGKYRGTLSVFRRWRFKDATRVLVRDTLAGGVHRGRDGGHDSASSTVKVIHAGVTTVLEPRAMHYLDLEAGDVLDYTVPSGAGFGDPFEREPTRVLDDVLDDKVSLAAAADVYGVVIDSVTMTLDVPATLARRRALLGQGR